MNKKWFSLVVLFLLCTTSYVCVTASQPASSDPGTSYRLRLHTKDAPRVAAQFIKEGYDVLDGTVTENSFELICQPPVYQRLQALQYNMDVLARGQPFSEIQRELNQGSTLPVPPGYPTLAEILNQLNTTAAANPSICKVYNLTTTYGTNVTYEGRHMWALKISDNVAVDEDEPNFLNVGNYHAREIVTPVLILYAINQMVSGYGTNPTITGIVDNYELWYAPTWNPDGYNYVYNVDNMWRKNRHPYPPGVGVDLNRNYNIGWNVAGSTDPTSEEYRGPFVASESETQTMVAFNNNRHFAKVLDYHSSGRETLYGYLTLTHPFISWLQSEAVQLSTQSGYGGSVRPPSSEGENYEWQLACNGSYSNLIETATDFQPSYASAQAEAVMVWPGQLWMLQRPISVSGHVTNAVTGAPVVASIVLQGVNFQNGEYYRSEHRFGRYHLFLPPATYTLNISAPGYFSQTQQVTVTQSSAEIIEIHLAPLNAPPSKPDITGPTSGLTDEQLEYRFSSIDPDNDTISYSIDWGDGTAPVWLGPYPSGFEANTTHQWVSAGTYPVKVKAKDQVGAESNWSTSLYVHINAFKRAFVFGLISEKNQTSELITFKAKFLLVLPSTSMLYHAGQTIEVSTDGKLGFIGEHFAAGFFKTLVL